MHSALRLWTFVGACCFGCVDSALALRAAQALARDSGSAAAEQRQSGTGACQLLEDGMLLEPKASCEYINISLSETGCSCRVHLPRNVVPLPNLLNPAREQVTGFTTFPPVPTVSVGPDTLYQPPVTVPQCPFGSSCKVSNNPSCVGFDSWGFEKVTMSSFTPASVHLQTITCTYTMPVGGQVVVPSRVQAFLSR